MLKHASIQPEAGGNRKVDCEISAVAFGEPAIALARVPAGTALRYAATAPRGEVKRYQVGHFDIYRGEPFEHAVRDQTEFLVRHLEVS